MMALKNPEQGRVGGKFQQVGEEPLSRKVYGVRLPESVAAKLEAMPSDERAAFIRAAICAAVDGKAG